MAFLPRAVLPLAALALVTGLTAAPAAAHPGVPAAVFDLNEVPWTSAQDLTSAQFETALTGWRFQSMIVLDLEIDVLGSDYRAGATLQRNTDNRRWWLYRDLTEAQYTAKQAEATAAGLRQSDFESYVLSGTRKYAAVWVENKENLSSAATRGLTAGQFGTWLAGEKTAGRMPVAVEEYVDAGVDFRYAAVTVANTTGIDWQLWHSLTDEEFGAKFDELRAQYRMLAMDALPTLIGERFAGIWIRNTNGRQWHELRNMSAASFSNNAHRWDDEGFRLTNYERYWTPDGIRYSGIWRQDGERVSWGPRPQIDALVQAQLDANNVPGISVAVMRNGVLKYARGFGNADTAAGTWMDSEHVVGLASVSKAVAGTLMIRLAEQGEFSTMDNVRDLLPGLPAHHTYRVGQLASNLGCVQHYDEGHGFGDDTPYATSRASAQHFWNDPLVCQVGSYHYSTHGYTILCAAFEAATGQNTADLIENQLTNPFALGTVKAERIGDTSVRRARVYNDDNSAMTRPDRSAKYCGGGMESSARDLAAFGHKLASGQIIGRTSLPVLWNGFQGSYANGWDIVPANGRKVVAKSGANEGTQSYLRVYPNDGITVAVLSNRKGGGHDVTALGTSIGELVANAG
jgi:CubicO group peptidase (beta-lactamase class C family)